MQNTVVHKAKELKPDTRAAIEQEFGRTLSDEDEISIISYLPHDEPDQATKDAAAARLREQFARFDARNTVTSEEAEAAVLEALRNVRPGYRE